MPDIVLTDAELEILSRCSGTAVKAYLRLRARMDFTTGVVGQRVGVSYQALREWTEEAVEKGAGEAVVQPSLKNIRTAVDQLVRRGLLQRANTEKLVFRCVLARAGEVRSKHTWHEPGRAKTAEPGTEPGTNPAGINASDGACFEQSDSCEPGTEHGTNPAGQKPPNPAHIRYPVNLSTPQAASTAEPGLRPEALIAAMGSAAVVREAVPVSDEVQRRAVEIAVWLKREQVAGHAMLPQVQDWAAQGVRQSALEQALAKARAAREQEGSSQAINVGFIAAKLRSVLNPPKPAEDAWWLSVPAMEAKARELGIPTARVGESMDAFKARIVAATRSPSRGVA